MVSLLIILVCLSMTACGTPSTKPPSTKQGSKATTYELPRATPEDVGMSTAGLQKIDELVQQYMG